MPVTVGLGPQHDWSSHSADAFGLMCIAYEEPSRTAAFYSRTRLCEPGSFRLTKTLGFSRSRPLLAAGKAA